MKNSALKYIFAGGFNTLLSYLVFLVIFKFTRSVALALISASVCGTFSSFTLNRYWIWKQGNKNSKYKFVLLQIVIIILNWFILHLVSLTEFPREYAQGFLYLILAFVTYHLNKKLIF